MECPLLKLCSRCACSESGICLFCIQLTLAVIAIIMGALIALNPKKTIEAQSALYRPFNWRLEPISMEKEIRNTRIMGLAALIIGGLALIYILIRPL